MRRTFYEDSPNFEIDFSLQTLFLSCDYFYELWLVEFLIKCGREQNDKFCTSNQKVVYKENRIKHDEQQVQLNPYKSETW